MVKLGFATALTTAVLFAFDPVEARLNPAFAMEGTTPVTYGARPTLKAWGKTYTITIGNYGLTFDFYLDLGLGYKSLFFWTKGNQANLLAMNPYAFVELANYTKLTLYIPGMYFTGLFEAWPYRLTFADY